MDLFKAITTKDTFTENGMPTHSTSSNEVLDLFFKMGGWSRPSSDVINQFVKAFYSNDLLTRKAMFYHRDIRGGQGRRDTFRQMFYWLCTNHPKSAIENLKNVVEFGRWDDVLVAIGTSVESYALDLIASALKSGDQLCAKWMPRENKKHGNIAKLLASHLGLTPKQYRQLLAGNTHVVENFMCAKEWGGINYNHTPSMAVNRYRTAFWKHDATRFGAWLESLSKPETKNKVNASAIYPHDIVRGYRFSMSKDDALLEEQWKALPNYMPTDGSKRILPVCDVSGSMNGEPMEVCVSLGLYLSERNVGPFKDGFITFSARPKLQLLKGNLRARIQQLSTAQWDMNTNLDAVFRLILSKAIENKVSESEMPTDILILSDMQFDSCVSHKGASAMNMIRGMYKEAGYNLPNIIFWNLRTSSGVPVKFDESGTALVSGFSPSVMKGLLSGALTPIKMMLNVLESERYERVV